VSVALDIVFWVGLADVRVAWLPLAQISNR